MVIFKNDSTYANGGEPQANGFVPTQSLYDQRGITFLLDDNRHRQQVIRSIIKAQQSFERIEYLVDLEDGFEQQFRIVKADLASEFTLEVTELSKNEYLLNISGLQGGFSFELQQNFDSHWQLQLFPPGQVQNKSFINLLNNWSGALKPNLNCDKDSECKIFLSEGWSIKENIKYRWIDWPASLHWNTSDGFNAWWIDTRLLEIFDASEGLFKKDETGSYDLLIRIYFEPEEIVNLSRWFSLAGLTFVILLLVFPRVLKSNKRLSKISA